MTKKQLINEILNDLCELEPEFKKNKKSLENIIKNLIEVKPNTEFNEEFKNELKQQLVEKINNYKWMQKSNTTENRSLWKVLGWFVGGAVVGYGVYFFVNIYIPFNGYLKDQQQTLYKSSSDVTLSFKPTIQQTKDKAFGNFSGVKAFGLDGRGGGNNIPKGKGGVGIKSESTASKSTKKTDLKKIPMQTLDKPNLVTKFEYIYTGKNIIIKKDKLPVYKEIDKGFSGEDVKSFIDSINIDVFDTKQLENVEVSNLSVEENKKYGYKVMMNLKKGKIVLNQNYENWPNVNSAKKLTFKDINQPKVLNSVKQFVKNYGIDTSLYGTPYVNQSWKKYYKEDNPTGTPPPTLQVKYPLLIKGKKVYNMFGGVEGLSASVMLSNFKVSSLGPIEKMSYISSDYPVEKDFSKILKLAKNGGTNHNPPTHVGNSDTKKVKLNIGTPELEYMKIVDYSGDSSQVYYVPAYIFPVFKSNSSPKYYQEYIGVPIIKDFIEK